MMTSAHSKCPKMSNSKNRNILKIFTMSLMILIACSSLITASCIASAFHNRWRLQYGSRSATRRIETTVESVPPTALRTLRTINRKIMDSTTVWREVDTSAKHSRIHICWSRQIVLFALDHDEWNMSVPNIAFVYNIAAKNTSDIGNVGDVLKKCWR